LQGINPEGDEGVAIRRELNVLSIGFYSLSPLLMVTSSNELFANPVSLRPFAMK